MNQLNPYDSDIVDQPKERKHCGACRRYDNGYGKACKRAPYLCVWLIALEFLQHSLWEVGKLVLLCLIIGPWIFGLLALLNMIGWLP